MKRVVSRLAYILPMAILAGVLLAGSLFMGAFSFADSSEAACGGRLPYRSCGWDRHDERTITRTLTVFTSDEAAPANQ